METVTAGCDSETLHRCEVTNEMDGAPVRCHHWRGHPDAHAAIIGRAMRVWDAE